VKPPISRGAGQAGEDVVRPQEALRTCSNTEVAEATIRSIGGGLFFAIAAEAQRRRRPLGKFVAELVRDFEDAAGSVIWARAEQAMQDAEQPVLAGPSVVAAHGLLRHNPAAGRSRRREWMDA
jgi:hypothetical protein